MKVLVPVDFHKTSFSAFQYASELVNKYGGQITLMTVVNGSFNVNDKLVFDPMKTTEKIGKERLKYFAEEYPKEQDIEIPVAAKKYVVRFGIPGFTMVDYAIDHDYDLIVMGTRDKHGIFDRLLGSSSSLAIKQTRVPILLIHENTKFSSIEKLVFAFDDKGDLEESLDMFKHLNSNFKAKTDFLHVEKKESDQQTEAKNEIFLELFEEGEPNYAFEIKTIVGDDIKTSLMDYCVNEKADMLAMVHRNEGLIDAVFNESISVRLAQKFQLPVMVFPDRREDE